MRFLLSSFVSALVPISFPSGTLVVNIIGCFVMGAAAGYAERNLSFHDEWQIFITTGFCGGFTTLSAFAFENLSLLMEKNYLTVVSYILASVACGIGAAFLGFYIMKS